MSLYNTTVKKSDEVPIEIADLYQYPVRGVLGFKVKSIRISSSGPLNDRLWVIINKETLKPHTASNTERNTYLRQEFTDSKNGGEATKVRLFLQADNLLPHLQADALPTREIMLDINKDYSSSEIIVAKKGYRGYLEFDQVNEWLSHIFEQPVILLRAESDRRETIDKQRSPNSLDEDRRRAFLTDAALHLVNRTSVK
jgi:uncharacterized protein YcbX